MIDQSMLPLFEAPAPAPARTPDAAPELLAELTAFANFGKQTILDRLEFADAGGQPRFVPVFVNEFWTAKQRDAHSLHEISYRACFKPQLPRFFIDRLTRAGDVVFDPFMGRGTTPIEAALLGRVPCGCDINPLSVLLTRPRLRPPTPAEVHTRLAEIDWHAQETAPEDLLTFYHPDTLLEIAILRAYLLDRTQRGVLDAIDDWIRVVALNRLTGHSPGFFSVYTLPPNQATSVKAQQRINSKRQQTPPRRVVPELIQRKTRQLLADCQPTQREQLAHLADQARLLVARAECTPGIPDGSVSLVVTSPPFLDVVQYAQDNWLRCWFCGIDPAGVPMTFTRSQDAWGTSMRAVFRELWRVVKPGGHVAFEVGEVQKGAVRLEEMVLPCGCAAGFEPLLVLVNSQVFTKTAQCWGIDNNAKGTNTNRIALFRRP